MVFTSESSFIDITTASVALTSICDENEFTAEDIAWISKQIPKSLNSKYHVMAYS